MGGRSGILLPYAQASSVLHPTSGIPPTCLQILFTCTPSLIGGQNMLGAVESCSTTAWPCWSWPVTTLLTALSACTRGDPLSPTVNLQGGSPVTWHQGPHTCRGTCHYQVTWLQPEIGRQVGDYFIHLPYHLSQFCFLHNLSIEGHFHNTALPDMATLLHRDQETTGSTQIKSFTGVPRSPTILSLLLKIPSCEVHPHTVAIHVAQGIFHRYV